MSTPETVTSKESARSRARTSAAPKRSARLGVGTVPQVSLLPSEVRDAGAATRHRGRLVAVVVVAAVVAAGAIAAASTVESDAQARLAATTQQSSILTGQLNKFDDVRALEREIALGRSAVKVGGATTIDWDKQIADMEAEKPSGYTVTGIEASGASPLADYAQGTTAVEPRRAATVIMTLSTSSIGDEFSVWLRRLRSIPAYADVSGTTSTDSTGAVTVTVTMHLSPAAITPDAPESK
ncbi:hypothetical protein [uncultured Amnibacterium sp.]|uniref:hypothetical protein n=1 Tax=uncultured Amnibacterium sp. TaxID=1631851 RepID=UPI0035C9C842